MKRYLKIASKTKGAQRRPARRRMYESAGLPTFTEVLDIATAAAEKAAKKCGVTVDWSSENVELIGGPDDTQYLVSYMLTHTDSARSLDNFDVELMQVIGKSSNPVLRAADAVAEVQTYNALDAGSFENDLRAELVIGFDALEG